MKFHLSGHISSQRHLEGLILVRIKKSPQVTPSVGIQTKSPKKKWMGPKKYGWLEYLHPTGDFLQLKLQFCKEIFKIIQKIAFLLRNPYEISPFGPYLELETSRRPDFGCNQKICTGYTQCGYSEKIFKKKWMGPKKYDR